MCNHVMWLVVHELTVHPEIRDFSKDAVWEHASFINGVHEEFGPSLKVTVFKMSADRGDIINLGRIVRITDQGATRPENQRPDGVYLRGKSYLNPIIVQPTNRHTIDMTGIIGAFLGAGAP